MTLTQLVINISALEDNHYSIFADYIRQEESMQLVVANIQRLTDRSGAMERALKALDDKLLDIEMGEETPEFVHWVFLESMVEVSMKEATELTKRSLESINFQLQSEKDNLNRLEEQSLKYKAQLPLLAGE